MGIVNVLSQVLWRSRSEESRFFESLFSKLRYSIAKPPGKPLSPCIHTAVFPKQNFLKCIWVPSLLLRALTSAHHRAAAYVTPATQGRQHFPGSYWFDVIVAMPHPCYHWSHVWLYCVWVIHPLSWHKHTGITCTVCTCQFSGQSRVTIHLLNHTAVRSNSTHGQFKAHLLTTLHLSSCSPTLYSSKSDQMNSTVPFQFTMPILSMNIKTVITSSIK